MLPNLELDSVINLFTSIIFKLDQHVDLLLLNYAYITYMILLKINK